MSLLLAPILVLSAEKPSTCVVVPAHTNLIQTQKLPTNKSSDSSEVLISSDRAKLIESETTIFEGNVVVTHQGRKVYADSARYHNPTARLDLKGNVRVESAEGDVYESGNALLNAKNSTGSLDDGRFYFSANQSRGEAKKMILNPDDSITFESVRFSTCPANHEDWSLSFRRLTLDRTSDNGIGRHAVLRIKRIPVFYTPYLRFPLGNHRQSGFLIPEFGSDDKVGTTVALPYYLNLAPSYDATITPRWMSKRGLQAETEFRYLKKNFSGQTQLDVLPQDLVAGTSRSHAAVKHSHTLGQNTSASLNFEQVTDQDYFNDLATSKLDSNPTHLTRELVTRYQQTDWSVRGRLADFQILDSTLTGSAIPYKRLPQLDLQMNPHISKSGLLTKLDMQFSRFDHPTLESADRLNIVPQIAYPMHRRWGYVTPAVTGYYTGYQNRSIGSDSSVSNIGLSIDSGLVFERKPTGKSGWQQTLEPRAFYTYTPYQDQSALPIIDTAIAEINFDSLFRNNRFIGGDRIGDANRLTLAIGSRWLDAQNNERFQLQLGQTYHAQNRLVTTTLPAGPIETESLSETVIGLSGVLSDKWYARSTLAWNPVSSTTIQNRQFIQYQPDQNRILSLGYRYLDGDGDSVDVSGQWKFGANWSLYSRANYHLGTKSNLDSYAGFRYQSCCWSVQTLASRRVDSNGLQNNAFEFQINLNGIASGNGGDYRTLPLGQSVFFDH